MTQAKQAEEQLVYNQAQIARQQTLLNLFHKIVDA